MSDQHDQVPDEADDLLTPSQVAGRLASGLARLAQLARHPATANSLATFADVLDTMREDAEELAAFLADAEVADAEAGEPADAEGVEEQAGDVAEAHPGAEEHPNGPTEAQQSSVPNAPQYDESLTWRDLDRAMFVLRHDAQTRVWAEQHHEFAETYGAALGVLGRGMTALRNFIATQGKAFRLRGRTLLDENGQPLREPAELQFAVVAVDGARALVEAFHDLKAKGAGEPLARVVSALANVQRGAGDPLLTSAPGVSARRHIDAAHLAGLAAAAMDARMKAGLSLSDASGRVARLFLSIRRHSGSNVAFVEPATVATWRHEGNAGRLTPKEAQGRWNVHRDLCRARRASHPDTKADRDWYEAYALGLEARIKAILENQGPGFTMDGKGRAPDEPARKGRAAKKIRASMPDGSKRSRG